MGIVTDSSNYGKTLMYEKFGKIPSLRNLLKERVIRDLPPGNTTLKFYGAVKLHGTHAAICVTADDQVKTYSRNREISLQSDNNGFAAWVNTYKQYFLDNWWQPNCDVWLYGEWIGPGIQKGVGINQLPSKQFVLLGQYYDAKIDGIKSGFVDAIEIPPEWGANAIGFYSIKSAPVNWILEIDMANPNKAIEQINNWVAEVERECPWASLFHIEGTGEGIVFTCWNIRKTISSEGSYKVQPLRFKAKGEKHQATSEKKVKAIDPIQAGKEQKFVDAVLTESRLNQGLEYLREMGLEDTMQNTGTYIKWVLGDIVDEEFKLLGELGLEWNNVKKMLNRKIVAWYKQPR